ncbi:rhomboid family intramembrane serine protease [Mucilaginibacter sp. P4]|uniref:rhomboid family intramembrane serine protease n=1 Tax=Mucilaginibacter sp. P4 TaxID=3383180 RepID=UPI0011EC15DB|nr:rhomboid family intramembrane serine protease [Mucilaginibacter gossypii]QEM16335.1 rhomboid family intramembrane serine protease [Mucilaginibacter gossypii]
MPITISIMILIMVTSVIGFINPIIKINLMLHPFSIYHHKQFYRLFTADLVHNDPVHLIINEAVIFFACGSLETYLHQHSASGSFLYLFIYLVSMLGGSVAIAIRHYKDFDYSSSGASGSAIGVMFGYMILQPHVIAFYLPVIGVLKISTGLFVLLSGLLFIS